MDRVVLSVEIGFVWVEMKVTPAFMPWFRGSSKLRHAGSKNVRQWHRQSEQESELSTAVLNGVGIVPILPLIMVADGRHCTPSNLSE